MWFTRVSSSFRVWFPVKNSGGTLQTNLSPTVFTATVINPSDTATTIIPVSQSSAKSGIYTFLVSSSFFQTHGIGDYTVVIEINSLIPAIVDARGDVLQITQNLFDDLAVSGSQMTLTSGTIDSIVNANWNEPINEHNSIGSVGYTLSSSNFSSLDRTTLNTIYSGTSPGIVSGSFFSTDRTTLNSIFSGTSPGAGITGSFNVNDRLTINSIFSGTHPGISGSLTSGTVSYIIDELFNEPMNEHNISGSYGAFITKINIMSSSIDGMRAFTEGRWLISGSRMYFYDIDNTRLVGSFDLYDGYGNLFNPPTHNSPHERRRVS